MAVSPDGRWVAAGLKGGGVRLHDVQTLRRVRDLPSIDGDLALAVAFSPDSKTIAVTGEGGSVELRDLASGARVGPPLPRLDTDGQALAFSPDGTHLAVADIGLGQLPSTLLVLDLRTGGVRDASLGSFARQLSYSADGELLAIAVANAGVELRDASSLRVVARLPNEAEDSDARWASFSPDGRRLAVSYFEGGTQLWNVATRRHAGPPLTGHEGAPLTAEFAPDGRTLATTATDGSVILWDVATRRAIGTERLRQGWTSARFSPDGRRLFALHADGDALRWEVDPDTWSQHACSVAGRELTRAEWDEFVPEQDYRRVCAL
jgi:WD40 repeat protein